MMSGSEPSPSIFPLEIFGCIIAHLAENPDSLRFQRETLAAVKKCALVSKDFASLCQPYVFRFVDCIGFFGDAELMLEKFIHISQTNPKLLHYVRDVLFRYSKSHPCLLSNVNITQAVEIFQNLSNLQKITISQVDFFNTGDLPLPTPVLTLLHDTINSCASRGSLRSLNIIGLDGVCNPDVLICPTLRELRFGGFPLPSFTVSSPHITIFDVHSMRSFDISVLSYLPNLEDLSIRGVDSLHLSSPRSGAPSFNLKKLSLLIKLPGAMPTLVEFYRGYARQLSMEAFKSLEVLDYEVPFEEDVDALAQILDEATSLQIFNIDTMGRVPYALFPLHRLQLPTKIPKIFSQLREFSVSLRLWSGYPAPYESTISELVSITTALSRKNVVEEFVIMLETDHEGGVLPSREPWSKIGTLLASPSKFPKLVNVEVALYLQAEDDDIEDILYSAYREGFDCEDYMYEAMGDLSEREGIQFDGVLEFSPLE